jgi:hypothetical protein
MRIAMRLFYLELPLLCRGGTRVNQGFLQIGKFYLVWHCETFFGDTCTTGHT